MRTSKKFILATLLMGAVAGAASAQSTTQTADQTRPQAGATTAGPVTTVDQAIDRVIAREHDEMASTGGRGQSRYGKTAITAATAAATTVSFALRISLQPESPARSPSRRAFFFPSYH